MDISDIIRVLANYIALTSLIPLGLFVYYYGTVAIPGKKYRRKWSTYYWRQNAIGRTLMYQKLAWISFLIFIIFSFIFPDWSEWTREPVRLVIYSSLVVLFWRVFYTLRQTQTGKIKDTNTGSVTTMRSTIPGTAPDSTDD